MMYKCCETYPEKIGNYTVAIEGIHTMLPIFMRFNGTNWEWEDIRSWMNMVGHDKNQVFYYA